MKKQREAMSAALSVAALTGALLGWGVTKASADMVDDIVSAGEIRCAITLTAPPLGSRDANNEPVGFDVDYCNDLAAALGVKATIVEVTWADRVPAIISKRADVAIAGASDTLERAQTIGFSIPYILSDFQLAVRKGSDIKTWEDLKGKRVATVVSSTNEAFFLKYFNEWNDPKGQHLSLQNADDAWLALEQGRVDAVVSENTAVGAYVKGGKFPNAEAGPVIPSSPDLAGIMAPRNEYGMLNYLNLFVYRQVRTGRFAELYKKWFIGDVPTLTVPGVYR